MNYKHLNLYTDGGARGNPGPAAAGYIIKTDNNEIIDRGNKYLGESTNNQAEYNGLILGLNKVKELKVKEVSVFMDSELIVYQLQRKYKVKNPELAILFVKVWNIILGFSKVEFKHVVRALNKEADAEVNKALDQQKLA